MTEPRRFPFGGVPVYNPQSLSKTEALAQFHARQAAYQSLMNLLREERPSHVLIIGTRGMGKTTLLQRVRYGVEDDAELNSRYLALAFPEEQYNVNQLHHFLLNTVDALADALERLKNQRMVEQVEKYVDVVRKCSPQDIEEQVPRFLAEISEQMHKGFLLLVDNADRLFETIEDKQQWRLRELLSSRPDLTFFGATTQASDGIYGPERAFFEFFKIHRLTPLTFTEVRDLLLQLSESVEEKEGEKGNAKRRVAEWLDADAARLRTLVQLTGGNPRTTVLLFHLVLDGLVGGAREYLEQLLDQVTPNYKGRVDELPPQAQQVLDAVALRWDPVTAMEIGVDTGLETNAVSTQLTRLVRQGILEKADPGESKKALYQVAERFFNIWYLMRASRRVRAKLRWFVEFLRVFFDSGELEQMAWERIELYRGSWQGHPEEIETAFAYVLASGARRDQFEEYLRQKCADSEEIWRPYLELIEPIADGKRSGDSSAEEDRSGGQSRIDPEVALRRAIEVEPKNAVHWRDLGRLLAEKRQNAAEAEVAYRKAIELNPNFASCWNNLGILLDRMPERTADAEMAYRKAIELKPRFAGNWYNLGLILAKIPGRVSEAETAYGNAIQLAPKSARFWNALGLLLERASERTLEAEAAFRKAIELEPEDVSFWNNFGRFLAKNPSRAEEAEAAFRKAIELKPSFAGSCNNLGRLFAKTPGRAAEAEVAFRKAIELDPRFAGFWIDLGNLLAKTPERTAEAELAFRKAIELDPKFVPSWCNLGLLLAHMPERMGEAEAAYRMAIELDPQDAQAWGILGFFLACQAGRPREAEVALRNSVKFGPENPRQVRNLGVLLYCELSEPEEATVYLGRAHELDPKDYVSAAIFAASLRGSQASSEQLQISIDAGRHTDFWNELLDLCQNYPPFGKILGGICDLVKERDGSNPFVTLYRAVALAQLGDFPRASVALEDALAGDPIDLLSIGQRALETFFAAAVRSGRVRECIQLIDKKEWKDAWRPYYEALQAVEANSAEYLKRTAVEIRGPALKILRRIAPQLPHLPERTP